MVSEQETQPEGARWVRSHPILWPFFLYCTFFTASSVALEAMAALGLFAEADNPNLWLLSLPVTFGLWLMSRLSTKKP